MKHGVLPSFMAKPWENVSLPSVDYWHFPQHTLSCVRSYQDAAGKQLFAANATSFSNRHRRHVHVSLRDSAGKNVFAISQSELESGGRANAAYDDTKFISQEAEWFLSGILNGIADGGLSIMILIALLIPSDSHANGKFIQSLGIPCSVVPSSFRRLMDINVSSVARPSGLPTQLRTDMIPELLPSA